VIINVVDVADGVLVNAVSAALRMVSLPRTSRRSADELSIAGWADIDMLIEGSLPGATVKLGGLSDEEVAQLEAVLKRDEVQAALQSLLAARLTDAPETYATKAREAVRLALKDAPYTHEISDYFDGKIGDLVGHLEGTVGLARLSQIRNEAYGSRIIEILENIKFQVAALSHADRGSQSEALFLKNYLSHVRDVHGKLEPPDFERRRKVPVDKIYVHTSIHTYANVVIGWNYRSSLSVIDLAGKIDRTVLLGDPGGGKTTAANVLANHYATVPDGKFPFLVTLRNYASTDPPERSIVGHIEHTLASEYQCPAPNGLVDRLLRTGRAVVIFDGLDELLNTYRRRDISSRVEQFCVEYPLTPVLVTSRLVGYDEARLDSSRFAVYRLGGFGDDEIAEYARKWFAVQEGAIPSAAAAEARTFLAESASANDLRSNPLLLSLMCILYRGEGSLPRDRTGIYARCADLLLRKWDEMRRIHRDLRDSHLIEPAICHVAWWLFTREDPQVAVTERQLVNEITAFLLQRGFESQEKAQATAHEFAESCSGRMWVLSDIGTSARGEKLYSFTHRTFLEYFTAVRLATVSDTPEDLARTLVGPLSNGEWEVVSQLAIQIKDRNSDRGADRIYSVLLDFATGKSSQASRETDSEGRGRLLSFLARSLDGAEPSPASVRRLTGAVLDHLFDEGMTHGASIPLRDILSYSVRLDELVADELNNRVSTMITSRSAQARSLGLRLILEVPWISRISAYSFWAQWARQQAAAYRPQIINAAADDDWYMKAGLYARSISVENVLEMAGGLNPLFEGGEPSFSDMPIQPYALQLLKFLSHYESAAEEDRVQIAKDLAAVGRHFINYPLRPLLRANYRTHSVGFDDISRISIGVPEVLDEIAHVGLLALICVTIELGNYPRRLQMPLGLPTRPQFRRIFDDWASERVNFVVVDAG
jgi:hypothetical protein